jgi:polysaccharide export outer membrane protein
MSKWVNYASCLLALLLAGTVLTVSAQNPRTETFGDSEYRLGPEDVVEVSVWKEEALSKTVVIRPDGKITLNLIGEIVASKKTAMELEKEIHTQFAKFFTADPPRVNVVVKEINSPKVSVAGEVKKPDVYPIRQKTTLLGVIALAGGLTEWAKKDKVVVIREGKSGPEQFKLDLESILKGNKDAIFYVQPGDTIYVH